jgi:ABC-type amino acid transport substrate-binding protein
MLAAIVLSIMLSTCSSPPSILERILRSGELKVVTRNTPAAFYYGADEPRGIEYELARGYAEKLGVSLRIYIDDDVFPDLVSGKAQIGAASLTIADTRRDSVTFGPGYQEIEPLIIYRSGTQRPRKLADLVGGRLDVVASSSHAALLDRLREQEPLLTWVEHTERSSDELIRRVAEGEIAYTVADSNLFELLRQFYPDLRVAFRSARRTTSRGPCPRRRGAARKHRELLRGDRGDRRAQADSRSLLLRIARVRLRRITRFHAPRRHAVAALPRVLPGGRTLDGHRLAPDRRDRVSGIALGSGRDLADRRARDDDADYTHGGHDGGRRPARRALEHSRGAHYLRVRGWA